MWRLKQADLHLPIPNTPGKSLRLVPKHSTTESITCTHSFSLSLSSVSFETFFLYSVCTICFHCFHCIHIKAADTEHSLFLRHSSRVFLLFLYLLSSFLTHLFLSLHHKAVRHECPKLYYCCSHARTHAHLHTRQGPVQSPSIQAKPCDSGSLIRNMSAAQQRHISVQQQQQQQQHAVRHPASPPRTPPSSRRDRSVGCALTSLHREAAEVARHWCRIDQPIRSGVTAATGIPLRLTSRWRRSVVLLTSESVASWHVIDHRRLAAAVSCAHQPIAEEEDLGCLVTHVPRLPGELVPENIPYMGMKNDALPSKPQNGGIRIWSGKVLPCESWCLEHSRDMAWPTFFFTSLSLSLTSSNGLRLHISINIKNSNVKYPVSHSLSFVSHSILITI